MISAPRTGQIDVALTNFATGFRQFDLIGDRVAPRVPVPKESGLYWQFGREAQENIGNDRRPRGGRPEQVRMALSSSPYLCSSHALEAAVPDEDAAAFSEGDLLQAGVAVAMGRILLKREIRLAAALADTSVVTGYTDLSAGANVQWDDVQNSSPITDVISKKKVIRRALGISPNLLVLGDEVLDQVVLNKEIVGRFQYAQAGSITAKMLSAVFFPDGDGEVIVGGATVLDKDGLATSVWGKSAWLLYSSLSADRMDPSACKTFMWDGAPGTSAGIGVITQRDPYDAAKASLGSVDMYYDELHNVVNAGGIYYFKKAIN